MREPMDGAVRPDLDNPAEIAAMVRRSSASVARDDLLGPVFNELATSVRRPPRDGARTALEPVDAGTR